MYNDRAQIDMYLDWDLLPARIILDEIGTVAWQSRLETDVLSLKDNIKNIDHNLTFKNIVRLDKQLSTVWSARELTLLNGEPSNLSPETGYWLVSINEQFANIIYDFKIVIDDTLGKIDKEIQNWVEALTHHGMYQDVVRKYRDLLQKWHNKELSFTDALILRTKIDPDIRLLESRAIENKLTHEDLRLIRPYSTQSQQYFNEIIGTFDNKPTSIERVRKLEANMFKQYWFSLTEALRLIGDALNSLGRSYKKILDDILLSNRLKILNDQTKPDFCVDSPLGSYIQVYYDGSFSTLNRLAHEVGHAIHQSIHRQSTIHYIPLTDIQSETWAMSFENFFLLWLGNTVPLMRPSIENFIKVQEIEMNYRHRMLHDFELTVCTSGLSNPRDITSLWVNINRKFYGMNVLFDKNFETAWMEIHHLVSAPFYLSTYAFAKEQANSTHFIDLINEYIKKDENYDGF